jgi:hypothetical protein
VVLVGIYSAITVRARCLDGFGMGTLPGTNEAPVGKADTLEGLAAGLAERPTRH